MNTPLLSICTSVYNAGDKLYRFLDSISNQTYENIELIIVDDNSNDPKTLEILNNLKLNLLNFKKPFKIYKNKKNLGVIKSFQRSLSYASGEYFAFPESDDSVDYDFYEILMESIKNTSADICRGLMLMVPEIRNDDTKITNEDLFKVDQAFFKYIKRLDDYQIDYIDLSNKLIMTLNTDITCSWFYVFSKNFMCFNSKNCDFFNAYFYGASNLFFQNYKQTFISPTKNSYYYYYSSNYHKYPTKNEYETNKRQYQLAINDNIKIYKRMIKTYKDILRDIECM